jgi:hypothetical protein
MLSAPLPTYVFEDFSTDLFQHGSIHSVGVRGQAVRLNQWRRGPTAREGVQFAVVGNFVELCVLMRFRSDNGPQFDADVFQDAL